MDLGVLIKVGKRPGKNGLLKDVMTWGPALLDEQPMVASVNEQPTVACVDEQPAVAMGESGGPEGPPLHSEQGPPLHSEQPAVACFNEQPAVAVGEESGGLESPPLRLEQPAVACFNEQPAVAVGEESGGPEGPPLPTEAPLVASVDEQPAVARRTRQPRAARTRNRRLPERTQPLTPAEQEGLGALHRFIRRVADARNAPVRILSALRPILEANDPESVWDLVLRRNPHETEDLALLRQSESLWRSQRSGPQAAGNAGSTRPRAQRSPVTMEVTPESASQ